MKRSLPLMLLIVTILLQACSASTPPPEIVVTGSTAIASEAVMITPETVPSAVPTLPQAIQIEHVAIPTEGTTDRATAHDNENSLSFETKKVKTGDFLRKNRFERPFTAVDMVYLPDVDIADFSITSDDTFFYIKISLIGLDSETQSLTGSYGVEIDRNADGRAEILLATRPPYNKDFNADSVAVYFDVNSDMGGSSINRPDDYDSDGFETIIYDLSKGVYPEGDPDLAWARLSTYGNLPAIEIAFKKWMFDGGKETFMWSVVSSDAVLDPGLFYFHDHFTAEEAGAANTDDPTYPLKDLAGIDNTCRVPLGFQVIGNEPLGCYVKGGEVEEFDEPSAEGAESTCSQFSELCKRTENSSVLFSVQ
ncbi:MAG: hypothetical protein IPN58_20235 [Anaerolineales bacterium]|nr:hypothetical protein [Anaerolineales bacterium]